MFQKVKKEYQVLAAVILLLVVSVGYLFANQKSELSEQLNDSVKAQGVDNEVVILSAEEMATNGNAKSVVGPSYNNQEITFQSTFGAAGDEIIYEVVYKNMSSETKVLKSAELYPDVTDAEVMTYGIGNVKEKDTKIKPNEALTVYVTAKVSDTATVITAPNKTYKVELEFE